MFDSKKNPIKIEKCLSRRKSKAKILLEESWALRLYNRLAKTYHRYDYRDSRGK